MSNYLSEFVDFVYTSYETIEENPRKKLQAYFSQACNIKKILDVENITKRLDFLKKIETQIKDVENLDSRYINDILEGGLFEINTPNIRLYRNLHENKLSCLMENKKVLEYLVKDEESFDRFIKIFISRFVENFNEDPKFLLLLLYTPNFNESLLQEFVQNITDETINYIDIFSMPKQYQGYVNIELGSDSFCKCLLDNNKLKKTWNNMIFSKRQLQNEENNFLIEYVNQIAQNTDINQDIDSRLNDYAYIFLFWLFTNNEVDVDVLTKFISVMEKSFIINRDNVIKIFSDKIEIETEFKNWNTFKCIQIIKLFLGLSFNDSITYLHFICYLIKNDIEKIVSVFIKERLELKVRPFGINGLIKINNKYRYNGVFSCLLYSIVEYNENNEFFGQEEVKFILETIDLDLLDDVIDLWKKNIPEQLLRQDVEKILAYDSIINNKLINKQIDKRKESLHFLKGLIGIVNRGWIKGAFDIMKEQGVFNFDNVDDVKSRIKLEKDYHVILDYIGENNNLMRFKKLLEYFVSHVEYCQKLYLHDKKGYNIDPSTCIGYNEYIAGFVQEDGKLDPHEVDEWNSHAASSLKNQAIKGQWDSFGDKKIRMVVKNHFGDYTSTKCFLDYGHWRDINNVWNDDSSSIVALSIRKNVNESQKNQKWNEVKEASIESLGLFDGQEPNSSLEEFFDIYMNL